MTDIPRIMATLASPEDIQQTVDALELAGFDRAQFGVMGLKALFENFAGDSTIAVQDATDDAVREPESAGAFSGMLIGGLAYAGAIVAASSIILAGGGLGIALIAMVAAGGSGGLLGALVSHGFEEGYAKAIEKQVEDGGLLLWIKPRDDHQNHLAKSELAKVNAKIVVGQTEG